MWPRKPKKDLFNEHPTLHFASNKVGEKTLKLTETHRIFVKDHLNDLLHTVTLPEFDITYRLNSNGATPRLIETIQRLVTRGSGNASRAYQNKVDLYNLYNGLIEEGQRLIRSSENRISYKEALIGGIERLAKEEIKNNQTGPFAFMRATFDIEEARSRLFAGEGSKFVNSEMLGEGGAAAAISPDMPFHGQIAVRPSGEIVTRSHPVYGELTASDYDGDFAHILMFVRKQLGQSWAAVNKAPALRLMGPMKMLGGHYDDASFLLESKLGVVPTVPYLAGSQQQSLLFSQFDQVAGHLDKLKSRASDVASLQNIFKNASIFENPTLIPEVEKILQGELDVLSAGIADKSPVGLLTSKVYTKEIFTIMEEMMGDIGPDAITKMDAHEFAAKFAYQVTRKNFSDERFIILEQYALKAAKRGPQSGDTPAIIEDLNEFRLGLQTQAKMLIAGKRHFDGLGSENKNQFMQMMLKASSTTNLSELSNLSDSQLDKLVGDRVAVYGTALKRMDLFTHNGDFSITEASQEGKLFGAIKRFGKSRSGKVVPQPTVLEQLMSLDVIRMHVIQMDKNAIMPQIADIAGEVVAPHMVNILGQDISTQGGMVGSDGMIRSSIIRGAVMIDSLGGGAGSSTHRRLSPQQILTYLLEDQNLDFEYQHSNTVEKFTLGSTTGVFSADEMVKEYNATKMAEFIVQKDGDLALLGTTTTTPRHDRVRVTAEYVQNMAAQAKKNPTAYQQFITKIQTYTPGGSKIWRSISGILDEAVNLYGSTSPLVASRGGGFTLRNFDQAQRTETNRVNVVLSHKTEEHENFARAVLKASGLIDVGFVPHGKPAVGNESVPMVAASSLGFNYRTSGDLGSNPKRNWVMQSQVRNAARVNSKIAVFEIDYLQAIAEQHGLTPEEVGLKLFDDPAENERLKIDTNKPKAMGTFLMLSENGSEKYWTALENAQMGEVEFNGTPTEEEIFEFNLKRKTRVTPLGAEEYWTSPFNKFEDRRKHPKIGDASGRFKIEPSHIGAKITSETGELFDVAMGGGEFAGAKSKIRDVGLNVFTMLAGEQNWGEERVAARLEKYLEDIRPHRDLLESGAITTGQFIESVTPYKDQILAEVGAKREMINIQARDASHRVFDVASEAYTFEHNLGFILSESEAMNMLRDHGGDNLTSEYGQRKLAGMIRTTVNVMHQEGQITDTEAAFSQLYKAVMAQVEDNHDSEDYRQGVNLLKVAANLGSQAGIEGVSPDAYKPGNLDLRRMFNMVAPEEPHGPPVGVQQAQAQAAQAGEAAAASQNFGGEAGQQAAQHMKRVATMPKMGMVAGLAAGVLGLGRLRYTESERERRRRMKGHTS